TTAVGGVRTQLKARAGGSLDSRLLCVVCVRPNGPGKVFRTPSTTDFDGVERCRQELLALASEADSNLLPHESINPSEPRRIPVPLYGMSRWRDLFNWDC